MVEFFVQAIADWGFTTVTIRSDQEPALKAVLDGVKSRRSHKTVVEHSPKYSHASMGYAEQGNAAIEVKAVDLGQGLRAYYKTSRLSRGNHQ